MSNWTVYAQEDTGHVSWVEIYRNQQLVRVHEGASSSGEIGFNPGDTISVVFVDWDEVNALDAGGIETIAELVNDLAVLPNDRRRDALQTVEEWLEVNEPEDHDGSEELWQDTIARVADQLSLLR